MLQYLAFHQCRGEPTSPYPDSQLDRESRALAWAADLCLVAALGSTPSVLSSLRAKDAVGERPDGPLT